MEDVACLIAPRPLLIESAMGDSGFPIEASRRASDTVRRAYAAAGVPQRFNVDEFDGSHEWSRRQGIRLDGQVALASRPTTAKPSSSRTG